MQLLIDQSQGACVAFCSCTLCLNPLRLSDAGLGSIYLGVGGWEKLYVQD